MELLLYAAGTAVLWILSLTMLLPFFSLLKVCSYIRNRWFSWILVYFLSTYFGPHLRPMRVRCFEILKEHLARQKKKNPLEVLEIGIGDGRNLQYYPENANLTALDMNESFEKYLLKNLKTHPEVHHKRTVIAMAENMPQIKDSSVDIVVSTFVLCSVQSSDSVLSEVKRVLKPGGKFVFAEHVAFPKSDLGSLVQRFVAPLWHVYFNGCCPAKDTVDKINKAGFSDIEMEKKFPKPLMLFIRPLIAGVATK